MIEEKIKENELFNYDFVNPLKYLTNPIALFEFILAQTILCAKCHIKKKIKFGKYCITIRCDCGVGILYPPRKDRGGAYLFKFVSKRQNDEFRKSKVDSN